MGGVLILDRNGGQISPPGISYRTTSLTVSNRSVSVMPTPTSDWVSGRRSVGRGRGTSSLRGTGTGTQGKSESFFTPLQYSVFFFLVPFMGVHVWTCVFVYEHVRVCVCIYIRVCVSVCVRY